MLRQMFLAPNGSKKPADGVLGGALAPFAAARAGGNAAYLRRAA